ncbi:flagellar hook protein FlgE [Pararobbsia alpina]|uniref:Flagellar hook protein FlgE n=1 Tax=Pararobbsia alpina TaxID=621374 RepID=A0A6S7AUJ3_9BURK|nr:flagellar hook protein FlgE [Pararobbsia alpina]CAB3778556.1 Flagellar hook protein FlgE [Pararobbsia alpina]
MGYSQALSGLSAASTELDVVGNNIANSSTYGFKEGSAEFADMYANTVATAVTAPVGTGVRTVGVAQEFGQGTFTTTGGEYDVAINGNGFFRLEQNGTVEYSRNGQFHTDSNGFIINAEGANLTGYPAGANGVIATTNPQPLQVPDGNIPPQASTTITATSLNLDSSEATPTVTPFDPTNSQSYNYSTQMTTYDSLGDAHTVNTYFVRNPQPTPPVTPATVSYTVYAQEDGTMITPPAPPAATPAAAAGTVGTLTFSSTGTLTSFTDPYGVAGANPAAVTMSLTSATGSNTPTNITFDLTGATAFGGTGDSANLQPNGYAAGNFVGVAIAADGTVQGTYSNGQTLTLGQIVLASFNNDNGLAPVGNNAWVQTAASGQPSVGAPESGTLGALTSGQLENSNVDLTNSLVDLITAQRFYQANAQSIKTQQTVDQTLLQM